MRTALGEVQGPGLGGVCKRSGAYVCGTQHRAGGSGARNGGGARRHDAPLAARLYRGPRRQPSGPRIRS